MELKSKLCEYYVIMTTIAVLSKAVLQCEKKQKLTDVLLVWHAYRHIIAL